MRRVLGTLLLAGVLAGFALLTGGASDGDGGVKKYTLVVDNAFGLIKGGDMKVAGVRAGQIGELELDRTTNRALVDIEITEQGFGSLRTDVHCEVRPQSLIGEYFVDCLPGTNSVELPEGSRIPVEQTSSTVPPDLVNNVLRRPYRERLSLILAELGAGVAGRGKDLNAAVRRAAPALRETDKVLAKLAKQNTVLRDLVADADVVVGDLAKSKKELSRWVDETRNTASLSAERRDDIAEGFRRLPGFLARLEPTMRSLGVAADNQAPALKNLQASAGQLEELFDRLEPFAKASTPAFKALGEASVVGRDAVKSALPAIDQLKTFSKGTPELGKNLAIILEHLDDRDFAVEEDPRSPGGKGYTGLEALLAYVYDQTLSTNVYDSNVHYLKVSVFGGRCANYADLQRVRNTEGLEEECAARLGPNAVGIGHPDPTKPAGATDDRRKRAIQHKTDRSPIQTQDTPPAFQDPSVKQDDAKPPVLDLPEILPGVDVPPIKIPPIKGITDPDGPLGGLTNQPKQVDPQTQVRLLDYLLGDG